MVDNALVRAVTSLQQQSEDHENSKQLKANAQRYQELTHEVNGLLHAWNPIVKLYQLATAIGVPTPTDWADLRRDLRNLLGKDFGAFQQTYLSVDGVRLLRQVGPSLVRRMNQMKGTLNDGIRLVQQRTLDQIDHLTARVRIRKQCGLSADEASVQALRNDVIKLFSILHTVKPDGVQGRWQELTHRLTTLDQEHSLENVRGLSPTTVTFLQRLMSDDKNRPTLAELSRTVFDELQQFPTMLGGIMLVRKGEAR